MASGQTSELPQFYGGTTANGELVRRPGDEETAAGGLSSPARVYDRDRRNSPDIPLYDRATSTQDNPRSAGLRRRVSSQGQRRHSNPGDFDRPGYSGSRDRDSQRVLRLRDDGYYRDRDDDRDYDRPSRSASHDRRDRDRDDDFRYNPDRYERRSRPPRSYRNQEPFDPDRPYSSKPGYEETRADYRARESRHNQAKAFDSDEDLSVDGYNYDRAGGARSTIDFKNLTKEQKQEMARLPWTQWMNSSFKNHFVATIGEFVGTTMFLFFAFSGTQVANINSAANDATSSTAGTTSGGATGFDVSVLLYISLIFGFSLMVNVWVFFRISGGLFNPAVTLGMVLTGAIPVVRACFLFFAQMAGGVAASAIVLVLFPTPLNVRTTLAGGASIVQGVFIEAILTAELVFTIFMLAKEKHKATFIAPVGIGLALFIAEMVGVYYTGGSLNPARSFGPCAVTATFDPEHWVYWVGPILGSLIAVFFYKFIKILEYEMANPGQDGDAGNDPTKSKEKFVEMRTEAGTRNH